MTSHTNTVPPPAPPAERRRPWWDLGITFTTRQAIFLLLFLAGGVAFSLILDQVINRFVNLDPEDVERWIDGFGVLAPLVYIGLLASTIIFTPLPSVPVDIAGGLAFGLFVGTLYTLLGGMIGATINFYVARRLGRGFVERKVGAQAMAQIDSFADRAGARFIVATRLIPLFNFDWISYAAGLTMMPYRTYALASLLGMTPPVIGIVYVGDVLLTHPGRSTAVFTLLVVWSAVPPVLFLLWTSIQALKRRARRAPALPPSPPGDPP